MGRLDELDAARDRIARAGLSRLLLDTLTRKLSDKLTHRQIAAKSGIKPESVRQRLWRARKLLAAVGVIVL